MKTITDLPPELLPNVFRFLPIYSQRQCLAVSRLWNAFVRSFIPTDTDKLDLHGDDDVQNFSKKIQANPDCGRHIRRLNFILQTDIVTSATGDQLMDQLMVVLNGCPDLAEIDFVGPDSSNYFEYMMEQEAQLPKLEFIRMGELLPKASLGTFAGVAFRHRRTINQLKIHIDTSRYPLTADMDINTYFCQFTALKVLHLKAICFVVLDELLAACPLLQKLGLEASLQNFKVIDPTVGALAEPIIETIELHHSLITAETYVYLRDQCRYLHQLSVFGHASDDDDNAIMPVFHQFKHNEKLPIINIAFKDDFNVSPQVLGDLHTWFPHVRQVEFKKCSLTSVTRGNSNIMLDFADLHLEYLSIGISHIIRRKGSVRKVALKVISGGNTTWYQRAGKAKSRHEFQLIDQTKYYTTSKAEQQRLKSSETAVITIKAAYVNNLRFHTTNRGSKFNQLIHLDNDEEVSK